MRTSDDYDINNIIVDNNIYLQKLLEINQIHLINAYKQQNSGNYHESLINLEKMIPNLKFLGKIVDRFPHLIRENREILSQAHYEKFIEESTSIRLNKKFKDSSDYNKNDFYSRKKPKQVKNKWTKLEEDKFKEGLERYGHKSIYK